MKKIILFLTLWITSITADDHINSVIKKFETYIEEERKNWEIPGLAIGIIKEDQVVFSKGFGQRGLNDTRPVDENTIFQTGSLSKAFTSALTAIGVDKKWVKWEDKVVTHMPSFRLSDPWVTSEFEIVDLFCQRSGLPAHVGDNQSFLGFSQKEIIDNLIHTKPESSFRSQFAYQNIFFVIAAEILKFKTGLNYSELLDREIFKPLGMLDSTSTLESYLKAENSAEWLIRSPNGKVKSLSRDFTGNNWNYILGPAGGINSNLKDMCKWMILQINKGVFNGKQLISQENMEKMHRPFIFVSKEFFPSYYALGWVYQEYSPYPIIWHNGATLGVYNVAAFIPQEKLGIIILSNVRDTQLSLALSWQFFDMYFGKDTTNWSKKFLEMTIAKEKKNSESTSPPKEFPPMPLEIYTGKYHSVVYGDALVEKDQDNLVLKIGKLNTKIRLKPWSRDIFTLVWPAIDEGHSKVFFSTNKNSLVTTMNVQIFSEEGNGLFEKIDEK